jgi:hypothetical protein
MIKKLLNFIYDHAYTVMLSGFGVVALAALIMVLRVHFTGQKDVALWGLVGIGIAIYLAGRAGIVMQRRNARKQNREKQRD